MDNEINIQDINPKDHDFYLTDLWIKGKEVARLIRVDYDINKDQGSLKFELKFNLPGEDGIEVHIIGRGKKSSLGLSGVGTEVHRGIDFYLKYKGASKKLNIQIGSSEVEKKCETWILIPQLVIPVISTYIQGMSRG